MGLDIVEVVMALEDEFDVEIPEDDFGVLYDRPLSATRDYILARWPYGCEPPAIDRCRTQQAFYFLRGWARDRGLEGARGCARTTQSLVASHRGGGARWPGI